MDPQLIAAVRSAFPPGPGSLVPGLPVTPTVAGRITRGLMGALLGPAPRRRRRY